MKKCRIFPLLVEGNIIMSASKTVFSGSSAKDENAIGNGERELTG